MRRSRLIKTNTLGVTNFNGAKGFSRNFDLTDILDDDFDTSLLFSSGLRLDEKTIYLKGEDIYLDNPNFRSENEVLGEEGRMILEENWSYLLAVRSNEHLCTLLKCDVFLDAIGGSDHGSIEQSPAFIHLYDKLG